jgi:hypothetical protein
MGRLTLTEQEEQAAVHCPDLLRRLKRLEQGEAEPAWILSARREIAAEVLRELAEGLRDADRG